MPSATAKRTLKTMSLVSVLGCGTWFFLIEEQLYCNSVFAFPHHEDVGVTVLSHLCHKFVLFQTLERLRAAWDHVRVHIPHGPTPFSRPHSVGESTHSLYFVPCQIQRREFLEEDKLLHNTR